MQYQNLILEITDRIALVRFNRPEALNALNSATLREFDALLDELALSGAADALVITGEGRAFVAGADIAEMRGLDAAAGRAFGALGSRVFRKLELLELPVIAAVNGFALGGGCELAMACDIRLASDKAKFGQPEVTLGITPGFSGTQRLPRIVGASKAKELIFTGEMIKADEALRVGLVSRVTAAEELLPAALELAKKIAKNARRAVAYSKAAVDRGLETDIDTGIALEADLFGLCFATGDQKEGMTAFLEKRAPAFTGK
ncbi:MAG: enoyl-CoA hydratase/isomerase family protein [Spirochaetaceae bacterium]|nr:enoyl-CoA hydratase/isomerase family protein [Spirochaetaceae bacterium]